MMGMQLASRGAWLPTGDAGGSDAILAGRADTGEAQVAHDGEGGTPGRMGGSGQGEIEVDFDIFSLFDSRWPIVVE